jgi:hypothetical protein
VPPVVVMATYVGRLGFEPRTHGLKVRCTAIVLTPRDVQAGGLGVVRTWVLLPYLASGVDATAAG